MFFENIVYKPLNQNHIMRLITLILFLLLIKSNLDAQEYQYTPFPDSNAVWSEIYYKPISEPCPSWVYNKYALFNEDTIINDIIYHKLFHTNSTEITKENSECIGGIREDSLKRIFVISSSEFVPEIKEVMIYDFGLNEGDTIDYIFSQGVDFLVLDSII